MSGEVSFEDQDDHEETTLNWNLSHISMASGFGEFTNNQQKTKTCKLSHLFFHLTTFISSDPEQFTKEILSPATSNTPEPSQDDIGIGKLVSNVEELRKSLSIIREKSVTPINSPRGASNATTPNTAVKRDIIPQSPPTKDTDNKLQDMRYVGF